ncbi:MAG: hypothetical protein HGA33_03845 [Candidatus Moranbacteria bacterium]|nr:hypothetical protein [Candidatus Moranbacteria bacterium]
MESLTREELFEQIRQLDTKLSKEEKLELLQVLNTLVDDTNSAMEEHLTSAGK